MLFISHTHRLDLSQDVAGRDLVTHRLAPLGQCALLGAAYGREELCQSKASPSDMELQWRRLTSLIVGDKLGIGTTWCGGTGGNTGAEHL